MGRYSGMTLNELRREKRGLYGDLLLAKLEGIQVLHEQQDYRMEDSGSIVEPVVTEYYETEVEFTRKALIDFLTSDKLYWTISELKASVELEEMKTYSPLNAKVDTTVGSGIAVSTTGGGGATTGAGVGSGMVTEPLQMRKDGAKHGGRLKATGHAYVGDPDIVPNSDTRDKKNEFTKVKLYYDKIPEDLLK
tara:strand:- start:3011 stop:3586 length:576 start_codon:yes stop_codon:yes gene_type:complete